MTSPTLLDELDAARSEPSKALQTHISPGTVPAPGVRLPLTLFALTLISTTSIGMRYMANFLDNRAPLSSDADILPLGWVLHHLSGLASGLPFSLTLITILLAHEFGHYFACRAFKVRCSLPYLLPAPSLSGSFGAVIQLRSRVRSRAALLTIGAMGPICGFAVAIATSALGLWLSRYGSSAVMGNIQAPFLISVLHNLLSHFTGATSSLTLIIPHPVLVASWMGILITAINLIPAGQLDGGHILYAISPKSHAICTRIVVVLLFVLGMLFWVGWILWAGILLMPGMRHPSVPSPAKLNGLHLALLPLCGSILLLTFTFAPFSGYGLIQVMQRFSHHF
jgi:Zn-dependent protease